MMRFVLRFFIKRIPREGFKSLSVPALALVLAALISMMGGIRRQQAEELEYVTDTFEVKVEVADVISSAATELNVTDEYIRLFTDAAAEPTLERFLKDVELKRTLELFDFESELFCKLIGITSVNADERLDPLAGVYIEFFSGYDESIFRSEERVCVVNEGVYNTLDPENPVISVSVRSTAISEYDSEGNPIPNPFVHTEFSVIGLIYGAGGDVYCPYLTANALGMESDGEKARSDLMFALMSDNRLIDEFKVDARNHFVAPGTPSGTFTLTIYDRTFNDVTATLRRNITLIDVATPFVYALSACIGFVASFLLTRRRKPEFAMMRSIGVNRKHVFIGVLTEQAALCFVGVAAGCVAFNILWGYVMLAPPVIFFICYVLGSAFSANSAAGTDVLKILREKE